MKRLFLLFTFFVLGCLTACNLQDQIIRFGSGNKGGFYNKFANSFADKINAQDNGVQIQVKITEGSSENIRLIEEGFVDLAIVQADVLKDFLMGSRSRHLITALGGLYTESIQIIVAEKSGITSVEGLKGYRVSVGEEESGVYKNAQVILDAYSLDQDQIQIFYLNFKEAAYALQNGDIDAFFCTARAPTPSIAELAQNKKIRVISLNEEDIKRITGSHPELTKSVIATATYANQDSSVQTIGTKAVLVASQTVDKKIIKDITQSIFDDQANINFATSDIPVDFHPGASEFYASRGIQVKAAAPLQARNARKSAND